MSKKYPGEERYNDLSYHSNFVEVEIPGFPTQQEEKIEFPDIAEIMLMPMWQFATAEHIMKNGTHFQKMLLDKAPLTNKYKYVTFSCLTRFIYPGVTANSITFGDRNEWHIDGIWEETTTHVIMNDVQCRTEFNTNPFSMKIPNNGKVDHDWFKLESLKKGEEWGLNPQKIESQSFATFTKHIHRAALPTRPEFRFFCRIQETDVYDIVKRGLEKPQTTKSSIWNGTGESKKDNFELHGDHIYIHYDKQAHRDALLRGNK